MKTSLEIEQVIAGGLGLEPEPTALGAPAAQRDLDDLAERCAQVSALPLLTEASADDLLGYAGDGSFG